MKRAPFLITLVISLCVEIALSFFIIEKMGEVKQDTVAVNECRMSVAGNWGDTDEYSLVLPYAILDENGECIYINDASGKVSTSINEAIKNNDTVLDVEVGGQILGKIIFLNLTSEKIEAYKSDLRLVIILISAVQLLVILGYFIYLKKNITDPFKKLNAFALRVAGGNLDLPLNRDKGNAFGDFTEAFDIMRSEIKKARAAEKKAYDDKNEMVAQLSHDIKTPVSSIKSTSEIGYEITKEEKTKEYFNQINIKTDQIKTLVDNLFNSSVSDVTEIAVSPSQYSSDIIAELIGNSDYLNRTKSPAKVPECRIFADRLRLQQAFDNVFMNSYKYADTDMTVDAYLEDEYLVVKISDYGPGVKESELPLLKGKYKRGSNVSEKDGAGLGLYLTDYFLTNMDGKLELKNEEPGFSAMLYIRSM